MLVSYMPLAANARELDELGGSRNKPTSPDVGGCRERFYLGGGMLLGKTRHAPAPAADESTTRDFPDGTTSQAKNTLHQLLLFAVASEALHVLQCKFPLL